MKVLQGPSPSSSSPSSSGEYELGQYDRERAVTIAVNAAKMALLGLNVVEAFALAAPEGQMIGSLPSLPKIWSRTGNASVERDEVQVVLQYPTSK